MKTKYEIEFPGISKKEYQGEFAEKYMRESIESHMQKNWRDTVAYEIDMDRDHHTIDGVDINGNDDYIFITKITYEPDTLELVEDALTEDSVRFTKAATGTLYISVSDSNYEQIRISDHNANVPGNRRSGNFEIDLAKVDDIADFSWTVKMATLHDDLSDLEKYQYEE